MEFNTAQKLACIERELRLRRRNYPRWIAAGQMSQRLGDIEIACMEAIRADYQAQEPDLFGRAGGNPDLQ